MATPYVQDYGVANQREARVLEIIGRGVLEDTVWSYPVSCVDVDIAVIANLGYHRDSREIRIRYSTYDSKSFGVIAENRVVALSGDHFGEPAMITVGQSYEIAVDSENRQLYVMSANLSTIFGIDHYDSEQPALAFQRSFANDISPLRDVSRWQYVNSKWDKLNQRVLLLCANTLKEQHTVLMFSPVDGSVLAVVDLDVVFASYYEPLSALSQSTRHVYMTEAAAGSTNGARLCFDYQTGQVCVLLRAPIAKYRVHVLGLPATEAFTRLSVVVYPLYHRQINFRPVPISAVSSKIDFAVDLLPNDALLIFESHYQYRRSKIWYIHDSSSPERAVYSVVTVQNGQLFLTSCPGHAIITTKDPRISGSPNTTVTDVLITRLKRHWIPQTHQFFPRDTQHSIRTMMMLSLLPDNTISGMPNELLFHIASYV